MKIKLFYYQLLQISEKIAKNIIFSQQPIFTEAEMGLIIKQKFLRTSL